jgi:hypothetical protein
VSRRPTKDNSNDHEQRSLAAANGFGFLLGLRPTFAPVWVLLLLGAGEMTMSKTRVMTFILALVSAVAASGCIVVVPSHHGLRSPWSRHGGGGWR